MRRFYCNCCGEDWTASGNITDGTEVECPNCGALYDPDDERVIESFSAEEPQQKSFRCNACGAEFSEPDGVYEKLRCPNCNAIAEDGTIECVEEDCPLGGDISDDGINAKREGNLIMVSHDDGSQATEELAERGFLMHAVTYSQDDETDDAVFDAVQSLCPFPVVRSHKMIAYMVSVIANAMSGLGLSVCEDVLDRNETVCESTEFSLKHVNADTETAAKVTMLPRPDDDLLCEAGDLIDNAVFNAIQALSDKELEWDMHYIGNVTMAIESAMESFCVPSCHPWQDDDENICYSLDDERCAHCQRCKQEE